MRVPAAIAAAAERAAPGEGTYLRCTDKACPLRPAHERVELDAMVAEAAKKAKEIEPNAELGEDVRAFAEDVIMEGGEEQDEPEPVVVVAAPAAVARDCIIDVWPFARPKVSPTHKYPRDPVTGHEPRRCFQR